MSSTKAAWGVFLADADVTSTQHAREEPWAQPQCCSAVFIYLLRVKAARPHVRDVPLPGRPVPSCSKCLGLPPSQLLGAEPSAPDEPGISDLERIPHLSWVCMWGLKLFASSLDFLCSSSNK